MTDRIKKLAEGGRLMKTLLCISPPLLFVAAVFSLFWFSFFSTPAYYIVQLTDGSFTYEKRRPLHVYRSSFTKPTFEEAKHFLDAVRADDAKSIKEWRIAP